MKKCITAVLIGLLICIGSLQAKPLPDGGVTVNEVAAILQEKGYWIEMGTDGTGNPKITSKAEGYTFAIYFYSLSEEGRAKSIQFCLGIAMKDGISLERVNEWNKGYRFGRVYQDEENDPILELDLDVEHGCNTEAIDNILERWFALITTFDEFLDEK